MVLKSGHLVGASEIGLLATVGVTMVKVCYRVHLVYILLFITLLATFFLVVKGKICALLCRFIVLQQLACSLLEMNLLSLQPEI